MVELRLHTCLCPWLDVPHERASMHSSVMLMSISLYGAVCIALHVCMHACIVLLSGTHHYALTCTHASVQNSAHTSAHLAYADECTCIPHHCAHRNNALMMAAQKGQEAAVAVLLKAEGIDTNTKDNDG